MFVTYDHRINVRVPVVSREPQRPHALLVPVGVDLLQALDGGPVSCARDGPTTEWPSTSFCLTLLTRGENLTGDFDGCVFQPHLYALTTPTVDDHDLSMFLVQADAVLIVPGEDADDVADAAFRELIRRRLETSGQADVPVVEWRPEDMLVPALRAITDALDLGTAYWEPE